MSGRGIYFGISHASHPKSGVPALPSFGVLLYLYLYRLTQKDQIRHGSQYGEGHVLGGQPRHCVCTLQMRRVVCQRYPSFLF